ncbi:disease resistance protein Roq1-like [Prosopis cineraria]|uniref:disease resistance protein Roq1-like n=1 Tax=Prosopis cineraria TaxID=364024 RepID=UPI00240EAA42|nr:disease resistance protein Roq1-like [Prosopis cineraria]
MEESKVEGDSHHSQPRKHYHVFLSFRGKDTRRSFTDHLYAALLRKGIVTFKDDKELERGRVISEETHESYRGLSKIVEFKEDFGLIVFPVFHGVNPSDIRHQKGKIGKAFEKHEAQFAQDKEKVQRWKKALTLVSNFGGWDTNDRHEADIIEEIVAAVCSRLEESERIGLVGLQRKLLSRVHQNNIEINDSDEGTVAIRHFLSNEKVLIVLDDVSHINQLENLVGDKDWFGDGTRITPDFNGVPNLECLLLEGCKSLFMVHESLGQHKKLVKLNLKDCTPENPPQKVGDEFSGGASSFWMLKTSEASQIGENMKNLSTCDVSDTNIRKVPFSIIHLTNLKELSLHGYKGPYSFSPLDSLP